MSTGKAITLESPRLAVGDIADKGIVSWTSRCYLLADIYLRSLATARATNQSRGLPVCVVLYHSERVVALLVDAGTVVDHLPLQAVPEIGLVVDSSWEAVA